MEIATSIATVLLAIGALIPIVGSLWKLFSVREQFNLRISEIVGEMALLREELDSFRKQQDTEIDSLKDQQLLLTNGLKETLQHVRDRSTNNEKQLDTRIRSVERYLEKTTDFTIRE